MEDGRQIGTEPSDRTVIPDASHFLASPSLNAGNSFIGYSVRLAFSLAMNLL